MQQTKQQSLRLFKSDFMESLTHVHPIVPLAFWGPIVAFLIWRTFAIHGLTFAPVAAIAVAGLVTWTLAEYCLHRFVFHFPARSRITRYLVFLFGVFIPWRASRCAERQNPPGDAAGRRGDHYARAVVAVQFVHSSTLD